MEDSRAKPRRRRRWRVPASILTALFAAASAAAARELQLSTSPSTAFWGDTVAVTVLGSGCDARLSEARPGLGGVFDVDLVDDCSGQSPTSFSLTTTIGEPTPGRYTVRVRDQRELGSTSLPFTVYDKHNLDVLLPEVATDAAPVSVRIGSYGRCRGVLTNQEGTLISLGYYLDQCFFFFPQKNVVYEDVSLGELAPGTYQVRVGEVSSFGSFPGQAPPRLVRKTLRVWDSHGCVPSATRLCLGDGRFAVTANWTVGSQSGQAHAQPLADNEHTGLLWFFGSDTVELTVKLLDGCPVNQHWWAFVSSSSTIEYTVTVVDTRTGARRDYPHAAGTVPALVSDTSAFTCASAAGVGR
jgi:hypothetical protein